MIIFYTNMHTFVVCTSYTAVTNWYFHMSRLQETDGYILEISDCTLTLMNYDETLLTPATGYLISVAFQNNIAY